MTPQPSAPGPPRPLKRKDAPSSSNTAGSTNHNKRRKTQVALDASGPSKRKDAQSFSATTKNARHDKRRQTTKDARAISSQASSKAFKNGELDVDKFVKAREYEIKALEQGMARAKKALAERAFQQVPKELRRRTASHNVKRVPKRLQRRAAREMVEDKTKSDRRKPSRHMRLRIETAKRLRALSAKQRARKDAVVKDQGTTNVQSDQRPVSVKSRKPRVKKNALKDPPPAPAKFRKRQIGKSWLPTHLYHAKRAHMTSPKEPLWRYAVPLTPTMKSYRPTHRASGDRGAVAWDMSYMATVSLAGTEQSLQGLLRALGIGVSPETKQLWETRGQRWSLGTRVWEGWLYCRDSFPLQAIAPATVIWCAENEPTSVLGAVAEEKANVQRKTVRKLLIRVHPSAFHQLWDEVLRLAKVQKPQVMVEDLRFEIGSIEITGPASTEALLGALWPNTSTSCRDWPQGSVEATWSSLAEITNPATLPENVLFGFDIVDPRLHHPPRTIAIPQSTRESALLSTLSKWPCDQTQTSPKLFDRNARLKAARALPSQKAINRRKSFAVPGTYPEPKPSDAQIPILLYATRNLQSRNGGQSRAQGTWNFLLPWKAVLPVWYSIMYYPLSTGGQPRFGGLREKRQIVFEAGVPWFPGDFPGTAAGYAWEVREREKRKEDWAKRPRGKRTEWSSVDLGNGKKGEIGDGWACDWERLLTGMAPPTTGKSAEAAGDPSSKSDSVSPPPKLCHITSAAASSLLSGSSPLHNIDLSTALATVTLDLLVRGVPQTCARIYRLPSSSAIDPTAISLRNSWLALVPTPESRRRGREQKQPFPSRLRRDAPPHVVHRQLAQSLLKPPQAGEDEYPVCPGEEDLIGFVTTGNFNLGEGRGTGIGCILLGRVLDRVREGRDEGMKGRLCVVRNAGQSVGRLARWDIAG
ncbi:Ribonucleases P/MRP protein subunit pop1 [Elasticomyces elasticus]|nr:Ribonucleases P/MRP protein subunit pop1 [Elasticomyces elasticus]